MAIGKKNRGHWQRNRGHWRALALIFRQWPPPTPPTPTLPTARPGRPPPSSPQQARTSKPSAPHKHSSKPTSKHPPFPPSCSRVGWGKTENMRLTQLFTLGGHVSSFVCFKSFCVFLRFPLRGQVFFFCFKSFCVILHVSSWRPHVLPLFVSSRSMSFFIFPLGSHVVSFCLFQVILCALLLAAIFSSFMCFKSFYVVLHPSSWR